MWNKFFIILVGYVLMALFAIGIGFIAMGIVSFVFWIWPWTLETVGFIIRVGIAFGVSITTAFLFKEGSVLWE